MVVRRFCPNRTWRDARRFKPYLRREFHYTCAYTLLHESWLGGELTFEVEHLRPRGRPEFAHLASDYANLYYVWGPCNRSKGETWPSELQIAAGFRFIDPCEDEVFEHVSFRIVNGIFTGHLVGNTNAGRFTIDECGLNRKCLRDIRRRRALQVADERRRINRLNEMLSDPELNARARAGFSQELFDAWGRITNILAPTPLPFDDPRLPIVVADEESDEVC